MRKNWPLLIALAAFGCAQMSHYSGPLPAANVRRLALHTIANKTQTPGIEDALLQNMRDEFLRDGRCPLVPEDQAEDVVRITLTRYLNIPIQYDSTLSPTAYKITIRAEVELWDVKKPGQALWTEKDLDEIQTYAAPLNLAGGLSEAQAQAEIWDIMSRDIVRRVIDGLANPPPASPAAAPQQAPTPAGAPTR